MSAAPTSLGKYYPDSGDPQKPADVAIVIPTLLKAHLRRALRSIYAQDYPGRMQVAVGVDVSKEDVGDFESVFAERPDNVSIVIVTLPYSTSVRHGGTYFAMDGGCLRTLLAYMSNSRHIAFLDDDNTYLPKHISLLRGAIEERVWSCGQRILVDEESDEHLAIDVWDSVGPDRGRFKDQGGFVDPNCLMVDRQRIGFACALWSDPEGGKPSYLGDRAFFRAISKGSHAMVMQPTVLYRIRKTNIMRRFIAEKAVF